MSGQARLVTELYSQGQASMVLARQSLVQPVQTSMGCPSSLRSYLLSAGPRITPLKWTYSARFSLFLFLDSAGVLCMIRS